MLIPPKKILKTSSGKIQRSACKQAYSQGQFDYLARLLIPGETSREEIGPIWVTENDKEIVNWLKQWVANNTHVRYQDVDEQRAFSEFGLTSIKLVAMINELEQFLKHNLDPWLAWECPTIFDLSQHIAQKTNKEDRLAEKIMNRSLLLAWIAAFLALAKPWKVWMNSGSFCKAKRIA